MSIILEAKNISKIYDEGKIQTSVLTGLDLTVHQGERVASLVVAVRAKVRCCTYWEGLIHQLRAKYGSKACA